MSNKFFEHHAIVTVWQFYEMGKAQVLIRFFYPT